MCRCHHAIHVFGQNRRGRAHFVIDSSASISAHGGEIMSFSDKDSTALRDMYTRVSLPCPGPLVVRQYVVN